MNNQEPELRFATRAATQSIIDKFKWPFEEGMQDWPLEVSDEIDLAFCIQEYPKLVDEDEKFLLMHGMLFALDETQGEPFAQCSYQISEFLKADFDIHKYTIYYWACFKDNIADGFAISPMARNVWEIQYKKR
ncbi:hypothetical protein IDJ77_19740 [Mucilaginibacter sp. ZT4R22]|uniref:Uncharacterized protein n=1 Tax=Mucilaginibacter pankratovii TaxID=2772110 RepID=A0ABR7WUT2_9SPHI|nr:hypothetical protein [Mucilaginibacter pankratovii]MBD1366053.1 hypothetical protein [Mucilaginibacter pankratovii]